MSFWKGWSRGASSTSTPAQESPLEAVKRIARENTRRERMALEAKPRLKPNEVAVQVSSTRTLDDLKTAYSTLKGIDFCDVVAAVVKSGKLPGRDVSFALHLREWVRTGAHLQLSSASDWGPQEISALSSLKLMMVAEPSFVISSLREDRHGMTTQVFSETSRNHVRDSDWPPRGFIDVFLKNHRLLESKCRTLFGTFD
jgi:hypothetical protein